VRLCERFHCLPSQLLAEPSSFLSMLALEAMSRDKRQQTEE
jgi:hypothetical protein